LNSQVDFYFFFTFFLATNGNFLVQDAVFDYICANFKPDIF